MIIYVSVSNNLQHPSVYEKAFSIDIDPTLTIENLKVLITLRFVDLGPDQFELVNSNQTSVILPNNLEVYNIPKINEQIQLEMIHPHSKLCILI